ncbi:MAG TPA: ATP phosphoribosyltransferase [Synergistales bacterium]|nr:ATP phosphoribosyltransferase [Synergistaceae bacterium]HOO87627.1 ATP phosphoribosyltransferase [Synergistales bacterium]HPE65235.1 ATP phosphoribosyltransferase [Synergistales bacterium]
MLTIALPTGRVFSEAAELLMAAGLPASSLASPGRKLVFEEENFRYILAKPSDVPLYVSYGAADLAFAGGDVLQESALPLVEILDTGRGRCRVVVAGPASLAERFRGHASERMWLKVATKYPRIADNHFSSKGAQVDIIHLHGSIELAPKLGLSDCILDIVQTGSTLKANHLEVLEHVSDVSLRLVASKKSVALRWADIRAVSRAIKSRCKEVRS